MPNHKLRVQFRSLTGGTDGYANCFARLHPTTARTLYTEAVRRSSFSSSVETGTNHWRVSKDSLAANNVELDQVQVQFLPLRLTLYDGDGDDDTSSPVTIFVSYNGGICRDENIINLPKSTFPQSLRTTEHVHVLVDPLPEIRSASSVWVEPLTTQDWELLEVHASWLEEGGLLDQVSVVYPNQVLSLLLKTDFVSVRVLDRGFSYDEEDDADRTDDHDTDDDFYSCQFDRYEVKDEGFDNFLRSDDHGDNTDYDDHGYDYDAAIDDHDDYSEEYDQESSDCDSHTTHSNCSDKYTTNSRSTSDSSRARPKHQCLRLVADTQVVVAPKPRNGLDRTATTTLWSGPIRVLFTASDISSKMKKLWNEEDGISSSSLSVLVPSPPPFTAWMHPKTLQRRIPGWKDHAEALPSTTHSSSSPPVLCVTVRMQKHLLRHGSNQEDTSVSPDPSTNDNNNGQLAVAKLCTSELVPLDHIAMHPNLRYQIDLSPLVDFATIQIITPNQVEDGIDLFHNGMLNASFRILIVPLTLRAPDLSMTGPNSGSDPLGIGSWLFPDECILDAGLTNEDRDPSPSLSTSAPVVKMVLSEGAIFSFGDRGAAAKGACSNRRCRWRSVRHFRLKLVCDGAGSLENNRVGSVGSLPLVPLEDLPFWLLNLVMLSGDTVPADLDLGPGSNAPLQHHGDICCPCVFNVNGDGEDAVPLEVLVEEDLATLSKKEYFLNLLPNTFPLSFEKWIREAASEMYENSVMGLNTMVLTGKQGCGKTHWSVTLAAKLRCKLACATVYLDCAQLQSSSQVRMRDILGEVSAVFGEAMRCQPSVLVLDDLDKLIPNTETDDFDANSRDHHSGGSTHQSNTNPVLVNQSKLLADHVLFLLDGCLAQSNGDCFLILTCESKNSLHKSLLRAFAFGQLVDIPSLKPCNRITIFQHMFQSRNTNLTDKALLDDFDACNFAKRTDGYRPQDIASLSSKVYALQASRAIADEHDGNGHSIRHDLDQALSAHTPLAYQSLQLTTPKPHLRWNQIGGLFRAKAALSDVILRPIKYTSIYRNAPIALPRSVLLYGPPGCGKSSLVPALAHECNFRLITCRGPELLDRYIGASEAKVRQLFERARAASPAVLFLDEFDALAPRRGSDHTGVTDRVVNQLLTFLDGVEGLSESGDLYVIAATSRPDKIDPALLRPGRIEKHIFVGFAESRNEWNDIVHTISTTRKVDQDVATHLSDGTILGEFGVDNGDESCRVLSAADVKGMFDTAHLLAIREFIDNRDSEIDKEIKIGAENGNGKNTDKEKSTDRDTDIQVLINTHHLKNAYFQTRPSLSIEDRKMYHTMYSTFYGSQNNNTLMIGMGFPLTSDSDSLFSPGSTVLSGLSLNGELGDDPKVKKHSRLKEALY